MRELKCSQPVGGPENEESFRVDVLPRKDVGLIDVVGKDRLGGAVVLQLDIGKRRALVFALTLHKILHLLKCRNARKSMFLKHVVNI